MAARHFSFKNGKIGAGAKHAEYLAGMGKYARDDVRHLSDHNLPEWAADGRAFFAAADANERSNGRSYSEIEFAIPREAPDPVNFALQHANKLLSVRHVYRLAVHDKPAADGGRNIHAHLMFSERRLDGIERDSGLFFRRANTKHPERGGAAKDRTWNDRQNIDRLRRGYEAHALAFGITVNLRSNEAQGLGAAEPKIGPRHRSKGDRWRDGKVDQVQLLRRGRSRMLALREEIENTKRELQAARRERARQDANACEGFEHQPQRHFRSPLSVMCAEIRKGRTVYRWESGGAAGLAALVDRGDRVSLVGKPSRQKVRAMVELAKAKSWGALVLTGSDEFKRLAIREALLEGLDIANPELATVVEQEQAKVLCDRSQIELARRWLMTQAPIDALEAAKLKDDPKRLQRLFRDNPEAQRWALAERQRAEGIPEPLLGFQIDRELSKKGLRGVVRHVANYVWIEPDDRPGCVVPIFPSLPVRPGQRVVVQSSGELTLPDREYTLRPR